MPIPTYDVLLETTAVVSTVLQFLSGVIICRKYIQKKSTGESSGLPFICGFLSTSFWLRYGLLTGERSVALVNVIGIFLFLCYTMVYYVFSVNKKSYMRQFGFVLCILFGVWYYTDSIEADAEKIRVMGLICCIITVCFFAAPLTMLVHVIRMKNSESLPFPLIAMTFLVSVQWVIYGVIISDTFIQIPNFLGCLLSLLQLCLFVVYPPKSYSGQGYRLVDQASIF
ncbi:sugar transporter SWEET1 [Rhagoletis pomonella]|uniref:sugar transporter SWEET1 n=1 Tax=Rhagoletis pomonella TaxID=28610 RepID=UPI001784CADD|nr:sugar transporter SWEET1 [Rhagoletis pomonella]